MGRTREEMEHAAVDALDATRREGRQWFGMTANEVVKRVLDAALPDFREATIAAPAQRPAAVAEAAVMEALRPFVEGHDAFEAVEEVLAALGRRGLLSPGDVVVKDARAAGLGVLVDGRPVEPHRVHLVRPSVDGPPTAHCGACGHVALLADVAPTDPCPACGEDRLVAIAVVPTLDVRLPAEFGGSGPPAGFGPDMEAAVEAAARAEYVDQGERWQRVIDSGNLVNAEAERRDHARRPAWEEMSAEVRERFKDAQRVPVAAAFAAVPVGRPPADDPGWTSPQVLVDRVKAFIEQHSFERDGLVMMDVTSGLARGLVMAALGDPKFDVSADAERRDSAPDDLTALISANPRLRSPDIVSRMIDARDCLMGISAGRGPGARPPEVNAALRWLEDGIEEGRGWRAAMAGLRATLRDEPEAHLCTCGDNGPGSGCVGCSEGFTDRCRFELAIRALCEGLPA